MINQDDLIRQANTAKAEAGWPDDGSSQAPIDRDLFPQDEDVANERVRRAFAEGVEAGIRYALGDAPAPFETIWCVTKAVAIYVKATTAQAALDVAGLVLDSHGFTDEAADQPPNSVFVASLDAARGWLRTPAVPPCTHR